MFLVSSIKYRLTISRLYFQVLSCKCQVSSVMVMNVQYEMYVQCLGISIDVCNYNALVCLFNYMSNINNYENIEQLIIIQILTSH